jgi:DNA-nicking Smr family endonuclease
MHSNILEMKQIDLHGLTHKEAVEQTENFVLLESANSKKRNEPFQCRVITGNSPKLQIQIIREIVDKYDFDYHSTPYNHGEIIISDNLI